MGLEPLLCTYCQAAWDTFTHQFPHTEDCYIRNGVMRVLGRKKYKAATAAPKKVEWLEEEK